MKSLNEVFDFFLECFNSENAEKPLNEEVLMDPSSPELTLIMYFYSMEPPFYAELNRAIKSVDSSKLNTMGPFARAIHEILIHANYTEGKRADPVI